MPKFSILVPVHNQFWDLRRNFASFANQTYKDYEICVVDDASFDASGEVLNVYAHINSNIKLLHHHGMMGMGPTRNDLVTMASGDYLIFVNPCDALDNDFLANIADALSEGVVDVLRHRDPRNPNGPYSDVDTSPILAGGDVICKWFGDVCGIDAVPGAFAIRRELYDGVSFPNVCFLDDFAIIPYLIAKASRVKSINYEGYHYTPYKSLLHSGNWSEEESLAVDDKELRLLSKMIELSKRLLEGTRLNDATKKAYFESMQYKYDIWLEHFIEIQERYSKPRC